MKSKLIILLGVIGVLLFPNIVSAAEVTIGTSVNKDETGYRELSIDLALPEGDTVSSVSYKCEACELVNGACDKSSKNLDIKINPSVEYSWKKENPITNVPWDYYTFSTDLADGISLGTIQVTNNVEKSVDFKVTCDVKFDTTDNNVSKTDKVKAKEKVTSPDARLSLVEVSQGTMNLPFSPDVYDYVIYGIADTINSIRFKTVECNVGECTWDITGGKSSTNKTVTLNQGENNVTLNVTSSDGTSHLTYNFIIYRGETTYNSAKLSSLSLDKYKLSPTFSKDVYEYSVTVPNKITELSSILSFKQEDENAIVETQGMDNLAEGVNDLIISVTNILGDTTNVYKVVINRMDATQIEVVRYYNDQVTYKDASEKEFSLSMSEFELLYNDEYKKIAGGEYKFDKDGYITHEEEVIYQEEQEEKKDKKGDKRFILIIVILVALLLIIIIACVLFRKKKPVELPQEKDEKDKIEDNTSIEENIEKSEDDTKIGEAFTNQSTISIDAALNDLMSTKQYEFEEESEDDASDVSEK